MPSGDSAKTSDTNPATLLNLGPVSARMLAKAGIDSIAQMQALSAVETYFRVKQVNARASLNLLWALAAGLDGVHWTQLSKTRKGDLLPELDGRIDQERRNNGN